MKKNKKPVAVSTSEQPFFNFKNEDRDRWNRRKAGKKTRFERE